jgi:hypothetical protein
MKAQFAAVVAAREVERAKAAAIQPAYLHLPGAAEMEAAARLAAQNAQFMAACQMRASGRCEGCGQ